MNRLSRTGKQVSAFYWGSGISDDVPALAWYLVSACAPLILGITALASLVVRDGSEAEQLANRLAKLVPAGAHDQIVELVLRTRRDSPLLLAVAVVTMVWASAGATGVIERVGSRLLGVPRPGMVALKLRQLGLAAGMALLLALTVVAATEATNIRRRLGLAIPNPVLVLTSAIVIAATCGLLYRFATTRRIAWPASLFGGCAASVFVEATPLAAGYYVRAVAGRTPVQVFLVLGGLLFSCYIIAQGLLIGEGLAVGAQRSLDGSAITDADSTNVTTLGGTPPGPRGPGRRTTRR